MYLRRYWLTALGLFGGILATFGLLYGGQLLASSQGTRPPLIPPGQQAPGTAVMAVEPPGPPLQVEAVFAVTITVAQVDAPVSAFQFDLAYDPALLSFRYHDPGAFLGATGRQVVCPAVSATAGLIRLACASAGPVAGPAGNGPLAVLVFQGTAEGTSNLTLSNAQVASSDRPPLSIPLTLQHSQVTIGTPATQTPTPTNTTTPTATSTATPTATSTATPTTTASPTATATPTTPPPIHTIFLPALLRQ
ncbi:MAG: cohesin domain-containing protein [Chloroflexi bacterium]|nr:cohesin domain-containing protein [Chloroflexota bacterium]MCI0645167.1 cohesin domain-containing protein [Chloroflexota bacterium]MCI0726183.1 cohesin domain-containing protein [Chloroflexota bacterium]